MKKTTRILAITALLATASPACFSSPAYAGNSAVEATLQSFGDLSIFYQALLNTGMINELNENQHYTIFAPTNAAFALLNQQQYPCFYSAQCRPQIAAMLRDHIVLGRHDLPNLITYGQGIRSAGGQNLHVVQAFVNTYTVDNRAILSKSESNGNIIYRIDTVLATPQQLAAFSLVPSVQPAVLTPTSYVTTERSITTYDPATNGLQPYPAGSMVNSAQQVPDNMNETTRITEHTAVTGQAQ